MNKVLVTGSKGLLGSSLTRQLEINNCSVIEHDRNIADLLNNDKTENFIHKSQPDTIIHCAARVGGVLANMQNNDSFFSQNIAINNNILEAAFLNQVENFVSILSTCIFPNEGVTYPLTVDQLDLGNPHPSNPGYSYAKRLLYYQTKMYQNYSGRNWISVIPTNIYGINDNFNLENSHLIPALIRKGYEASLTGDDFIIWGDGQSLRQFIHVDDLSRGILWAIDDWKSEQPLMIVNEVEYSIQEIVTIIADRFNILGQVKYDLTKPNGQFRKPAKNDLIDFKFTPLVEGINETIDWFVKNYNTIRK